MKSFLLLIVWITIHSPGYPQEKVSSIKGIITNSVSGEPLEQASVSLIRLTDLVVVRQAMSGKNGFAFRRVVTGDYLLCVSFIGYRPHTTRMAVHTNDSVYNAGIQLVKSVESREICQGIPLSPGTLQCTGPCSGITRVRSGSPALTCSTGIKVLVKRLVTII